MVSGSGHQFDPDQPHQFRNFSSAPVIVVIFDQRCPLAIFNLLQSNTIVCFLVTNLQIKISAIDTKQLLRARHQ
jgi:hypothetical protein